MRLAVAKAQQLGYVHSGVHAGHDGHATDRLDLKIYVWEALEWVIQDMGTTGLQLTYDDTIGDLVLSTSGGVLGAAIAARLRSRRI